MPNEKIINFANACQNKLRKEIHKAYENELTRGELILLKILVDYWNFQKNSCHPSIRTLAQKTKYCERYVIRLTEQLEDKGFIEVTRESISGRSKVNKYKFTDKILKLTKQFVKSQDTSNYAIREQTCQSLNSVHPNKEINNLITNNKNNEATKLNQAEASNSCVFQKEISEVRENPKTLKKGQEKLVQKKINQEPGVQEVICLDLEKQQIIAGIILTFQKQNIQIRKKYLEKFTHLHGIQKLRDAIEAAEAYINRLKKAGKAHSPARIMQSALSLNEPWWTDKSKQVELDAVKEAERQKLKFKPLFDRSEVLICPETDQKVYLAPYMFFSPQYFYKKLNVETGLYEWYVGEYTNDSSVISINLSRNIKCEVQQPLPLQGLL